MMFLEITDEGHFVGFAKEGDKCFYKVELNELDFNQESNLDFQFSYPFFVRKMETRESVESKTSTDNYNITNDYGEYYSIEDTLDLADKLDISTKQKDELFTNLTSLVLRSVKNYLEFEQCQLEDNMIDKNIYNHFKHQCFYTKAMVESLLNNQEDKQILVHLDMLRVQREIDLVNDKKNIHKFTV